jgi:hypothetical protein
LTIQIEKEKNQHLKKKKKKKKKKKMMMMNSAMQCNEKRNKE